MIDSRKPYRAENLIFNKLDVNKEINSDTTKTGSLEVNVLDSTTNKPIGCALVEISKITVSGEFKENAEGEVLFISRTDSNGNVPNIKLPELNELIPGNYDYYTIAVHLEEYFTAYVFKVQIYPNITSKFVIYLSHRSTGKNKFSFIIQPTVKQVEEQKS